MLVLDDEDWWIEKAWEILAGGVIWRAAFGDHAAARATAQGEASDREWKRCSAH